MRVLVAAAVDFIELFKRPPGSCWETKAQRGEGLAPGPRSQAPHRPLGPGPGGRDGLTDPASCTGMEMEAYGTVGSVDFPRTEAGDLAGTVHPQLRVCETPGSQPWDVRGA
eukprot:bmy_07848T0